MSFKNVSQIYDHAACSVKGGNLLQSRTPVTEGISYLPTTHTALQINICIVQKCKDQLLDTYCLHCTANLPFIIHCTE